MDPKKILEVYKNYAVIGVSEDTEKFGYKIYKRLKEKGYNTYGISPRYKNIDGDQMYTSLEDISSPIDVVVFVVNKKFANDYIIQMRDLGIGYAWMQPGTYDEELLTLIHSQGIKTIIDCILIQTNN